MKHSMKSAIDTSANLVSHLTMSALPPARVTQKDVAREACVSHATVSLALRGHHKIPLVTRNKILAIAKRLGYSPDPMLGALSAYRCRRRPAAFHCNLAWVDDGLKPADFYSTGEFCPYLEGARERAGELGFGLEMVNLADYHNDRRAVQRVLFARGITGLLIAPAISQPRNRIDLEWARFSAVRFGYCMLNSLLHTVTNAQFNSAFLGMENLVRLGYRRIGYMREFDAHSRTGGHFLGGFIAAQEHFAVEDVPVLRVDVKSEIYLSAARSWINQVKPEVILAPSDFIFPYLKRWGFRVPEDIGFASLAVEENDGFFSGIHQNGRNIGRAAVNLLVSLLERQEKGIPETPTHVLIDGVWKPGQTVVPKKNV